VSDALKEGWGFPPPARFEHYFRGGRSLCGRWHWDGEVHERMIDAEMLCGICLAAYNKKEAERAGR